MANERQVSTQFTDPVGAGFVASVARPDGNVTGFASSEFSIYGEELEVLTEIAPGIVRAAVVGRVDAASQLGMVGAIEAASHFEYDSFAHDGGLLAYGPNVDDIYDRAAGLAVRILRGAKPADLPLELPTRFQFAVNLKTAKAIGVTIPEAVLLRADDVIE